MSVPVDPAADAKAVWDDLSAATVESLDPDTGATLASAAGVTVLHATESADEEGGVTAARKSFWLVAAEVTGFALKKRDRLTDALGVKWLVESVGTEAFGTIYVCRDCVRERESG